jgi:glycosyl transferase family 2
MTATPIALFTYNRAEHTERVLQSLANCSRLDECLLHIYCDAPKTESHVASVEDSRRVVREHAAKLGAHVIERNTNFGLARSVVNGVTDLCSRFGRVIVLEDDLVLNAGFIEYMLQALDRYADAANVYQISGYMFPVSQPANPDAFFLSLITTWGWATWQRAWQIFDWDATDAREELKTPATRKCFDLNNSYPYAAMLEKQLNGSIDSWGILFWWQVFKRNGLALHPRQSLVWNGGFDNTGTNCGDQGWSNERGPEDITDWTTGRVLDFPKEIVADREAFDNVCRFLKKEQYPASLSGRIRRRLRLALGA